MSEKAITISEEVVDILTTLVPKEKITVNEKPDGAIIKAHAISQNNEYFRKVNQLIDMGCECNGKRSDVGITLMVKCPVDETATV